MALYAGATVKSVTYAESGNAIRLEYPNPEPPPAELLVTATPCSERFAEAAERAMNAGNLVDVQTDPGDNRVTSVKVYKP